VRQLPSEIVLYGVLTLARHVFVQRPWSPLLSVQVCFYRAGVMERSENTEMPTVSLRLRITVELFRQRLVIVISFCNLQTLIHAYVRKRLRRVACWPIDLQDLN
jgi:hypothetical protein